MSSSWIVLSVNLGQLVTRHNSYADGSVSVVIEDGYVVDASGKVVGNALSVQIAGDADKVVEICQHLLEEAMSARNEVRDRELAEIKRLDSEPLKTDERTGEVIDRQT